MSDHVCDSGNFDRTVCPEPCGTMHSYCDTCGERQDPCAHDDGWRLSRRPRADAEGVGNAVAEFMGRLFVAVVWDVLDPLFRLADRTVTRFANETHLPLGGDDD